MPTGLPPSLNGDATATIVIGPAIMVPEGEAEEETEVMKVQLLRLEAIAPAKATDDSAGYGLTAAESVVIPAGGNGLIGNGVAISIPIGTCGRIITATIRICC